MRISQLALGLLLVAQPLTHAQNATFTTGYCGGFLLRASGLIQEQSMRPGSDRESMVLIEKTLMNAGTLLMLRSVSDGTGVRDGDRAAAYAVSELGKSYLPLLDKTKPVHHMAMGCLAYANEVIKK
jgi:hypothetical protein